MTIHTKHVAFLAMLFDTMRRRATLVAIGVALCMVGGTTFIGAQAPPQGGGTIGLQQDLATHDARLVDHDANVLDAIAGINGNGASTHGVIEIDQARAEEGGGFPFRIDEPGSYRLTSNLTVDDENTGVITIFVPNVTLDLNGFAIQGPVTCVGTPVACSSSGTGIGISAAAIAQRVNVMNGSVTGMGNIGVFLPSDARVENLHVTDNAGVGIFVGAASIVRGNSLALNGSHGIESGPGSLILENTFRFNGGFGLTMNNNSSGYASNVFRGNDEGSVMGGQEIGGNLCSASTTCP